MTKAAIAVACALGASAVLAQTVQRGENAARSAAQPVAQAPAPVQTAQAGAAATGAQTGGVLGGVGTAGTVGSTTLFVGSAVAATAGASDTKTTVQH